MFRPFPHSIYNISGNIALKWLYQLRVGLSVLNDHKWRHMFRDTPSNLCQNCKEIENTAHFFLECTKYLRARQILHQSVINLHQNFRYINNDNKVKFLLYGKKDLQNVTNNKVLLATLVYLKTTQRFD